MILQQGRVIIRGCPKCGGTLTTQWRVKGDPQVYSCVNCGKEVQWTIK